jgi:hypothetical protein
MNEATPKDKLLWYIRGYKTGVSFSAIPPELSANDHFQRGWEHGRNDRRERIKEAQEFYGAKLEILRIT